MSMIHSSCAPVGFNAVLRWGMARLRTVRSITVIMQGRARTARPIQALRGALWWLIQRRRTGPPEIDRARRNRSAPTRYLVPEHLPHGAQAGNVRVRAAHATRPDREVRGAEAAPHLDRFGPVLRGPARGLEAAQIGR